MEKLVEPQAFAPKSADFEAERRAEQAGTVLMAARMALRKGDFDKARGQLKEAFALAPGDPTAIELLGDVYLAQGEQEKAVQLFERALERFPKHAAFEEKLALCYVDLEEMERDRQERAELLESGDRDKILERSAAKAGAISLFLPGAGQFYNDENEKGAVFLGVALVSFLGWNIPMLNSVRAVGKAGGNPLDLGKAIANLSGFSAALFWLMLLVWLAATVWSVVDCVQSANRYNEGRRRSLGL